MEMPDHIRANLKEFGVEALGSEDLRNGLRKAFAIQAAVLAAGGERTAAAKLLEVAEALVAGSEGYMTKTTDDPDDPDAEIVVFVGSYCVRWSHTRERSRIQIRAFEPEEGAVFDGGTKH